MPHLQKDLYNKYKDKGLIVLGVGREHDLDELKDFVVAKKLSFPVVADPDREIYSKYAKKQIPRNYVVDQSGKVIWASVGFDKEEFAKMKKLIESKLIEMQ